MIDDILRSEETKKEDGNQEELTPSRTLTHYNFIMNDFYSQFCNVPQAEPHPSSAPMMQGKNSSCATPIPYFPDYRDPQIHVCRPFSGNTFFSGERSCSSSNPGKEVRSDSVTSRLSIWRDASTRASICQRRRGGRSPVVSICRSGRLRRGSRIGVLSGDVEQAFLTLRKPILIPEKTPTPMPRHPHHIKLHTFRP